MGLPISVQMGTPITEVNIGKLQLDKEIEESQRQAKQELSTILEVPELAPPQALARALTPELRPDSMSSRIPEIMSGVAYSSIPEELSFERMSARIVGSSIAA